LWLFLSIGVRAARRAAARGAARAAAARARGGGHIIPAEPCSSG
jgi:hypothetical protein